MSCIDAVITWVDSPIFQNIATNNHELISRISSEGYLKYVLRSIETHAPWINKIFIITNGQPIPDFIKNVTVIAHDVLIGREYLPTFNSTVIESHIHKINELSEKYIYFNDDIFLINKVEKNDFFREERFFIFPRKTIIEINNLANHDTNLLAAINTMKICKEKMASICNYRFAHVPHPFFKSIANEAEKILSIELATSRKNFFRADNDILFTNFIIQSFGTVLNRTIQDFTPHLYFNYDDIILHQDIMDAIQNKVRFLCINDYCTGGLDVRERKIIEVLIILERLFPIKSVFEF